MSSSKPAYEKNVRLISATGAAYGITITSNRPEVVISGTSTVTGAVTISGQPIEVTGSVSIAGQPVEVTGSVSLAGQPIEVTGSVTVAAPVEVTGTVAVQFVSPTGAVYGIKQIDGKPRFSSMPYLYDIAEGNVSGHTAYRRHGYNGNVGTAWEIIGASGGTLYWPTGAHTLNVRSSSVEDSTGSTGAIYVEIQGLGSDYSIKTETVVMDGTGTVATTGSFRRVFRARVTKAGAANRNNGSIIVRDNSDTYTLMAIPALEGRGTNTAWTVPTGCTAYITSWQGSESSNKGVSFATWARAAGTSIWEKVRQEEVLSGTFDRIFTIPYTFPAKTDMMIQAKAAQAGGKVSSAFIGWYET